jgi:integrase/recombinase XerD
VTVSEAVAAYVRKKQAYGRDYCKVAQSLNSFAATLGDLELSELRACHVALFLNKRRNLATTWYHKYMRIKALLRYWAARGELKRLPLPRRRASSATQFYPYIFSRLQIRQLLRKVAAAVRSPSCVIQSHTMKNLILFLYGTGLSVGDVLRIRLDDLDMQNATVKIVDIHGRADRIVPLGRDIKTLLIGHLRASGQSRKPGRPLFATKLDRQLNHATLRITFRRLCKSAMIWRQNDSVYQPRLHDLRHTFAVHRIILWHRQKASIPRMLPLLAAYMGMITVTAVEKYLLLAPSKYISQVRQVG